MQATSETTTTEPDCKTTQAMTALPAPARGPTAATLPAPSVPLSSDGAKDAPIVLSGVIGKLDELTDAEKSELMACEAVIEMGWQNFVEVGLALARIRDAELYRIDYLNFETYCHAKWDYGSRRAYHLISAAQLFKLLRTNCSQQQPENESQVRPLVGLSPEQAVKAWETAVEKAKGRRVTGRLVNNAVKFLKLEHQGAVAPKPARMNRSKLRQAINAGFGELLVMLGQKASHSDLVQRVEALYRNVQGMFGSKSAT